MTSRNRSATAYWFESKEELLKESLLVAAREEVERVERVVLALAAREPDAAEWAATVAAALAADLESDPAVASGHQHAASHEPTLWGAPAPERTRLAGPVR